MKNNSLISIVTVSYNAVETIEQTILSVINQSYSNIEYIIIDGGSTDGTVDIIKKYTDSITYWISESDRGIYDAMNKGIEIASGKWINFMNSGDMFSSDLVLDYVFNENDIDAEVIYGDRISLYSFGKFYHKADNLNRFKDYFPIFHQSVFVKVDVIKKYKFDLKYQICADYNQLYTLYKKGYRFLYIPKDFAICESESGISTINTNEIKRMKEDELIVNEKINIFTHFKFLIVRVKQFLREIIAIIYPEYFSDCKKEKRLLKNPRLRKL